MALQIALDDEQTGLGVAAPEAYARIVLYNHDLRIDGLFMEVEVHFNQQARNRSKKPIKTSVFALTGDQLSGTGGIRPQLYEWLKLQPEFVGALDV